VAEIAEGELAPMGVGLRHELAQPRDDGLACGGEPRMLVDQVERLVNLGTQILAEKKSIAH